MHDIEPYFLWRDLYIGSEDNKCPFFGVINNEFSYSNKVYNYYIHPQWDSFDSITLYMKLLFVDYEEGYCIMEMIGEWNDAIENDIMTLRRDVTDILYAKGVNKFILIAANVLNFHSSSDDYYQEWREQISDEGGWVVIIDMPEQSQYDFKRARLTNYISLIDFPHWRTLKPEIVFQEVESLFGRRLD